MSDETKTFVEARVRARNIKPGFFKNEELADLPVLARLLFIGLWMSADREGRLADRPKRLKAEIFPYDDCGVAAVHEWLQQLNAAGFIVRYEAQSENFIQILNWHKHQRPHHMESPSVIPPPDGSSNHYNHAPVRKEQRTRILERDGFQCVECHSGDALTIDHITPIAQGGTSDDSNLRTLCATCNNSRPKRAQGDDDPRSSRSRVDHESITPLAPAGSIRPDSLNPDSLTAATPTASSPPPQPQSPALRVGMSDVPKTAAAVRRRFNSADSVFVVQVANCAVQAWLSEQHQKIPCPDDADIADAVTQALADTQHRGPGLLLTTVPAVIDTWCQYGRQPPAISPGAEKIASNLRRMHARA